MIVLIWKLTSVPPLSERSQTFSGKPLLCSQTAGCTFSAKEKEEFEARIKYYVTTLGNMIIYYDSPGCSRLWPLSEVSHCSHEPETYIKYFSTFSEYLLFSEDLIWFLTTLLSHVLLWNFYWTWVLPCHSHNFWVWTIVIKIIIFFSRWLFVTTLSHNSFCICCQREQTLMIERTKYEIWVWFGYHFFLNNPPEGFQSLQILTSIAW